MKIFAALLVLIAFCTVAQAYSIPPTNITDTTQQIITDETEAAETPVAETENVLEQDAKSHPVETEPIMITTAIANAIFGQNNESNTRAVNSGNNNGSYAVVGIALILLTLIAVAIYNIRK
ncbi:hypothetical protein [uncultured Methanomethylovorans sp.]|uniref:hypothetical protein n=1 Tax=uncultured Methanomethylovorans sp. TaxID=183759 RepID=UPI002AA7C443|nr:hypothetical protein [uncultured Methanomethylovorans sp.]